MKKLFILMTIILSLNFLGVYGASDLLTCSFKTSSCSSDEVVIFYANSNFKDSSDKILSSNVAISPIIGYTKPLCCKINPSLLGQSLGQLEVNFVNKNLNCPSNSEDLMYLTSDTNSRVAIKENITNLDHFSKKMCVKVPVDFSKLNIFVSNMDYSFAGYSCLYRISNVTNGLISDCDAKFNGPNKYNQIVWAKLTENTDSLKCNSDCTSKLDGRVYEACGSKIT